MKKNELAFDMQEKEMETLTVPEMIELKGGGGGVTSDAGTQNDPYIITAKFYDGDDITYTVGGSMSLQGAVNSYNLLGFKYLKNMLKSCFVSLIINYYFFLSKVVHAQSLSDSMILERAFQNKNNTSVDSMLNSWSSQSVNKFHDSLKNDTIKLVYKVYSKFLTDYIRNRLTGENNMENTGNYFFYRIKFAIYL